MAILGAAAFALSAARFHPLGVAALLGPFILLVAEVALIDARTKLIPNRLVYPALGAALAAVLAGTLAGSHLSIGHGLIGLAVYGGGLLLIALAAPSSMGMGDVKLAALIGLVLGSVTLTAVWRAALAGIFAGGIGALVALTVFRYGRRQAIPYGPFLAIGAIAAAITIPRTG
jgi:leader peptidase (prepilin peptidase)/N-methyltransferase